jgi:hypothetical protein
MIFFALAGFLVTYILDAKDMKDAFYKGVAVPTLIISLANGVTSAEKSAIPVLSTTPTSTHSLLQGNDTLDIIAWFFSPAAVHAQDPPKKPLPQGSIEFDISPKDARNITITIMDLKGNVLAKARSDAARFKMDYAQGEYIVSVETEDAQKQEKITILENKTLSLPVSLEPKAFSKKLLEGVGSLLKR